MPESSMRFSENLLISEITFAGYFLASMAAVLHIMLPIIWSSQQNCLIHLPKSIRHCKSPSLNFCQYSLDNNAQNSSPIKGFHFSSISIRWMFICLHTLYCFSLCWHLETPEDLIIENHFLHVTQNLQNIYYFLFKVTLSKSWNTATVVLDTGFQ